MVSREAGASCVRSACDLRANIPVTKDIVEPREITTPISFEFPVSTYSNVASTGNGALGAYENGPSFSPTNHGRINGGYGGYGAGFTGGRSGNGGAGGAYGNGAAGNGGVGAVASRLPRQVSRDAGYKPCGCISRTPSPTQSSSPPASPPSFVVRCG